MHLRPLKPHWQSLSEREGQGRAAAMACAPALAHLLAGWPHKMWRHRWCMHVVNQGLCLGKNRRYAHGMAAACLSLPLTLQRGLSASPWPCVTGAAPALGWARAGEGGGIGKGVRALPWPPPPAASCTAPCALSTGGAARAAACTAYAAAHLKIRSRPEGQKVACIYDACLDACRCPTQASVLAAASKHSA